jgi:hypothetical protein
VNVGSAEGAKYQVSPKNSSIASDHHFALSALEFFKWINLVAQAFTFRAFGAETISIP